MGGILNSFEMKFLEGGSGFLKRRTNPTVIRYCTRLQLRPSSTYPICLDASRKLSEGRGGFNFFRPRIKTVVGGGKKHRETENFPLRSLRTLRDFFFFFSFALPRRDSGGEGGSGGEKPVSNN